MLGMVCRSLPNTVGGREAKNRSMATSHEPELDPMPRAPSSPQGPLSLLLVEDDRADALLVEELIADTAADIRLIWADRSPTPSVN